MTEHELYQKLLVPSVMANTAAQKHITPLSSNIANFMI